MIKTLFILSIITLTSCSSFYGKYTSYTDFEIITSIKIKRSQKFILKYRYGIATGKSFGYWDLKGDTIILNTIPKSDSLRNQLSDLKNERWVIKEDKIYWNKKGDKLYDSSYYFKKH